MGALHRAALRVFADYHQFHIQDGGVDPDAPTKWSDEDVARRVEVAANVVVVRPVRDTSVPVEIEVAAAEPAVDLGAYDHAARCSLSLPTGYLQLHECTGGEFLRLSVAPGTYSVLASFSALGSVDEGGLDGKDSYRVVLWPGGSQSRHSIRRFTTIASRCPSCCGGEGALVLVACPACGTVAGRCDEVGDCIRDVRHPVFDPESSICYSEVPCPSRQSVPYGQFRAATEEES